MKKLGLLFLSCIILASCGGNSEKTMTVKGNIKGLKKGTLYLQHLSDTTLVAVDSLEIDGDGAFTLKTEIDSPELFYLYLNKEDNNTINDRITFFGEPGIITINTAWNTMDTSSKITGSTSHEKYQEYQNFMSEINKKNLEIMRLSLNPDIQGNTVVFDSIQKLSDNNVKRGYLFAINFAINNKDSYVAPFIALKEIPDANKKYLDSIYQVLPTEIAASKYGIGLKNHLESLE